MPWRTGSQRALSNLHWAPDAMSQASPIPGPVTGPASPVTQPDAVRDTNPADKGWAELAAQLTPAGSMARIDTITARAVTTVTFIGTLLTGLGALGADQFAMVSPAVTCLAVASVIWPLSPWSVPSVLRY